MRFLLWADEKFADLAILSHDLLTCPVEQIKHIKAELTMVGGKVVYTSTLKNHSTKMNIDFLDNGMYVIHIDGVGGQQFIKI